MPVPTETRFPARRSGMHRKRVSSHDEVYRMLGAQRPVSSTLSPYVPLPAIGSRFRSGTSRSLPGPRSQRTSGDVLARRESEPLGRFGGREFNRESLRSRDVTPLGSIGSGHPRRQGSIDSDRDPSAGGIEDRVSPSAVDRTDKEPVARLERERTYDVLEPRFVHRVEQEGDELTDQRCLDDGIASEGGGDDDDVFGARVPREQHSDRPEGDTEVEEQLGRALKAMHLDKPQAFWLEL